MLNLKRDSNNELGKMIGKMMSIVGQNPEDLLTEEEISRMLSQTFTKFDVDNSNRLELNEFRKAWNHLGLKGSKDEVKRAFHGVDVDNSGYIDRDEFIAAVKSSVSFFFLFFFTFL